MMSKARNALVGMSAAAILTMAGAATAQDQTVELKIAHWIPPTHSIHRAMEEWAKSIEKASNGTIKYRIYPAQQLGKATDHYDMARDGIADVTFVNPGYQPGRFPIIAAGELPFLMTNAKGGSQALDAWYRQYAEKEMKDVKVCIVHAHDPGALHAKKKIETPDQLSGMKIRPAQATMAAFVTSLGGTNAHGSAPEARDMLEKGVADAITFPWGSVLLFKLDGVVKYHMDVPLYATTFVWAINRNKYNQMSAAQKKVIDDHCNSEWALKLASPWADNENSGREKLMKAPGHTVYQLTEAQLDQWKKAAEPLVKKWADEVKKAGYDADKILGDLKNELKKRDSAY
ncbi:TRAP transporter substrate-binding protein [Pseudorhodoplanes sp.]|uniref:TRAP transporter substrate-binding protein n=1 Tax=Pseudorhodoplanes sp. TaxID=1934341 RepID=UPI00391D4412